jgi:sterol desaturase/sphingolipid hydroxylase (fatty acid hydroxylase superfamily)
VRAKLPPEAPGCIMARSSLKPRCRGMIEHEPLIRVTFFGGVFAVMALWECLAPRRKTPFSTLVRWPNNLGLVALNTMLARLLLPTSAVGLALFVEHSGWGLFNAYQVSPWLAVAGSVILLDLAIYLQHVLFHAVPVLWRLHRMHHADLHFDATTGLRFHTVEIMLSFVLKFAVIAAIGAPAVAVLVFEVLLSSTSLFNHANVLVPQHLDRYLRWIVVTPDMHRVHHSIYPNETNSNFGFNLPWWDRLFGTYRAQPKDGHEDMQIGIRQFRTERDLRLDQMLIQPLREKTDMYPINER